MDLSVILTIHNKGWLASSVVDSFMKYTVNPFELVVVYDGCEDDSKQSVKSVIDTIMKRSGRNMMKSLVEMDAPNIHETRSNNLAMRACRGKYAIIVQDDMIINEDGWDARLMAPMKAWEDVFAVSARNAFNLDPGIARIVDLIGRIEDNTPRGHHDILDRNVFRIRQCINRGPLCLDMQKVKQLDYLDESFAPCDGDDADLSLRAYIKHGWTCGVYPIDYLSDLRWGTSRIKANTTKDYGIHKSMTIQRNWSLITARHQMYFHRRHDETRLLEST